jgi:hypothetical protein
MLLIGGTMEDISLARLKSISSNLQILPWANKYFLACQTRILYIKEALL